VGVDILSVGISIMAELVIQSGKLRGKRLVLPDKEVFIGRDEDCHVRLTSSLISRKHCALNCTPEGLWVRDLASQNGTFVNEVQISEPVLLKAGDVLQIGAVLFQVPIQRPLIELAPSKKDEKSGHISDADIASWLSDEQDTSIKPSDTTIIKHSPPPSTQLELPVERATPLPAATAAVTTPPPESARRPPRTLKEQAAEIIRRHWASVRDEEPKA
jgi:predicted component of type VI protein secretion system